MNSTEFYKIEKNIPLPQSKQNKWSHIIVNSIRGDSFLVKNENDAHNFLQAWYVSKKKKDGRVDIRFSCKKQDDGTVRIWAVEAR